jgi:hypothetical protein
LPRDREWRCKLRARVSVFGVEGEFRRPAPGSGSPAATSRPRRFLPHRGPAPAQQQQRLAARCARVSAHYTRAARRRSTWACRRPAPARTAPSGTSRQRHLAAASPASHAACRCASVARGRGLGTGTGARGGGAAAPQRAGPVAMQRILAWSVFAVAVCCYLNTLPATFTFDDNFAVVRPGRLLLLLLQPPPSRPAGPPAARPPLQRQRLPTRSTEPLPLQINNGDVRDLDKPLSALLRNDFWWAPPAACAAPRAPPAARSALRAAPTRANPGSATTPQGPEHQLAPEPQVVPPAHRALLPRHPPAVVARRGAAARPAALGAREAAPPHGPDLDHHGAGAQAARRAQPAALPRSKHSDARAGVGAGDEVRAAAAAAAAARSPARCAPWLPAARSSCSSGLAGAPAGRAASARAAPPPTPPACSLAEYLLARKASLQRPAQQAAQGARAQALAAALLFAAHPVHTEAVAGIVGHAELLCASLSLPALLMYFRAVDGQAGRGGGGGGGAAGRWRLVAAALLLAFLAALSKEIGITVVGGAQLWGLGCGWWPWPARRAGTSRAQDAAAPWPAGATSLSTRPLPAAATPHHHHPSPTGAPQVGAMALYDLLLGPTRAPRAARLEQLMRLGAAALVGGGYLATRARVTGGDQLVRRGALRLLCCHCCRCRRCRRAPTRASRRAGQHVLRRAGACACVCRCASTARWRTPSPSWRAGASGCWPQATCTHGARRQRRQLLLRRAAWALCWAAAPAEPPHAAAHRRPLAPPLRAGTCGCCCGRSTCPRTGRSTACLWSSGRATPATWPQWRCTATCCTACWPRGPGARCSRCCATSPRPLRPRSSPPLQPPPRAQAQRQARRTAQPQPRRPRRRRCRRLRSCSRACWRRGGGWWWWPACWWRPSSRHPTSSSTWVVVLAGCALLPRAAAPGWAAGAGLVPLHAVAGGGGI